MQPSRFQSTLVPDAPRARSISGIPYLAARAAWRLQALRGFIRLHAGDSRRVVAAMHELHFARGDMLFRAGEVGDAGHLLLLLEGEVSVDTPGNGTRGEMPIAVIGAGSILGELALLDGAPRSATCKALIRVRVAALGRSGLERLLDKLPRAAARLLAGLSQGLADRLRAPAEQLQMRGRIDAAARRDLDRSRA
jgi:CRP-like cAMP-binding protein